MEWNHLPVAGGIFDQTPGFVAKMYYIFMERAKIEEQKRREEEAKKNRGLGSGRKGPARPR